MTDDSRLTRVRRLRLYNGGSIFGPSWTTYAIERRIEMKNISVFRAIPLAALGLTLMLFSSADAGQPLGDLSPKAAAYTDTVVAPHGSAIQAPVSKAYWRGSRGYGGWYGPYHRPYRYGAFSGPYRYRTFYYGNRAYRCWWNGYRWKCPPRRVMVY
jgi:hypothetical protein